MNSGTHATEVFQWRGGRLIREPALGMSVGDSAVRCVTQWTTTVCCRKQCVMLHRRDRLPTVRWRRQNPRYAAWEYRKLKREETFATPEPGSLQCDVKDLPLLFAASGGTCRLPYAVEDAAVLINPHQHVRHRHVMVFGVLKMKSRIRGLILDKRAVLSIFIWLWEKVVLPVWPLPYRLWPCHINEFIGTRVWTAQRS